jgi:hypothetical protein
MISRKAAELQTGSLSDGGHHLLKPLFCSRRVFAHDLHIELDLGLST